MIRAITNMDTQRSDFVESLYKSIKKQTAQALQDHNRFIALAKSYVDDGLEMPESVELLMIDGLSREAAESYASMVMADTQDETGLYEYAFQFDDLYGKRWSSHEIGKIVRASSDEEAWEKAEEILNQDRGLESGVEPDKIISVNRIN